VGSTPASSTNLNEETNMPGIFLPPAAAALAETNTAIVGSNVATPLLAGYGGAIAPILSLLPAISAKIGIILAGITPSGAVAPPSKLTITSCNLALTQIGVISTLIAATTVQSIAIAGAPSPTYAPSAAQVTSQLASLTNLIQTQIVAPQLA
tara:strand:- start:130 stop:585 length:456 start_codon:yes stop_codon:yes gene_type:complete